MQIVDFTAAHAAQAARLVMQCYEEERGHVPALPPVDAVPDLSPFAECGLGVAALDGDEFVGFVCSVPLIDRPFQIENLRGVWVPIHAHGTVLQNRAGIYAAMYETVAEKWIKAGALNHAITLYAHDMDAQEQFFKYRFGFHGIDAIRECAAPDVCFAPGFEFTELLPDEFELLWPLQNLLREHFQQSPIFINSQRVTKDDFHRMNEIKKPRYFAVKSGGEIIGYMKLLPNGETFCSSADDMTNICGAYLLPEYRGGGVYAALLGYVTSMLAREGYRRIGVDFESFNPTARGFWLKHFTAYTHSVVRRIG